MPIQEQNIVFLESQVMDDVPEGGGAATGRVIQDGQMNNVFEDISDLDRAYGRFNLRKIFLAARTLSTDLYAGAKTVVTRLPEDPATAYTLFTTQDAFDTRAEAANRVEAYLYRGRAWAGYLLENHISGMRAINVLQRVGTALPAIGKTLVLVQNEGLANETEQYVRVTKVTVTETTFTDDQGDFTRWVVALDLSDALRHDFAGHTAQRYESAYNYTGKTRLRDTTVADATRYYGAQPLAESAGIGDLSVRAASAFTQLVPAAQTETPHANSVLNPTVTMTVANGDRPVEIRQQAHTFSRAVTAENRSLVHVLTLSPPPAPGTLTYGYMAQGNWYLLQDDGTGKLVGSDPSDGVGLFDYPTSTLTMTKGALPDVDSIEYCAWGTHLHLVDLIPPSPEAGAEVTIQAPDITAPIAPGTLEIKWLSGGVERVITDDGAGALVGDGAGSVEYATPALRFVPAALPAAGASYTVTYTDAEAVHAAGGVPDLGENVAPGSVVVGVMLSLPNGMALNLRAVDDAVGALRLWPAAGSLEPGNHAHLAGDYWLLFGATVGSVNYATGAVTLADDVAVRRYVWAGGAWSWQDDGAAAIFYDAAYGAAALPAVPGAGDTINATVAAAPDPEHPIAFTVNALPVRLVANSLRFTLAGKTYIDRDGVLFVDVDPVTGAGTPAGKVDYRARAIRITHPAAPAGGVPTITAALGLYGDHTVGSAVFRAAAAPLKPQSVQIVATTADGAQKTAFADEHGVLAGPDISGYINYQYGHGQLAFLEPVLPESLRYNATSYAYLPLDADILGIDAVRLPADGRVPIYRPGDVVMVMHTADTAAVVPELNIDTGRYELDCGRARIAWARVTDADGEPVASGYELDRAAGKILFESLAGLNTPLVARHTVADLRMVTDVQINGALTLARPLTHSYPAGESVVASCLIHGDRRARVSAVWDQQTWNGTWVDYLVGSEATATLDVIAHPIEVTNEGAETERWLLRWINTTTVELIGQRRGLVYSGAFNADIAPINPRTRGPDGSGGVPYLRIPVAANGGGWSAGNVVRINTVGAIAPLWIARSIQQSDEPLDDGADGCELYALGNIDRP